MRVAIRKVKFQFQYGAIKRNQELLSKATDKKFQFQYGAIKRKKYDNIVMGGWIFQFQYGAIKSRENKQKNILKLNSIQFI